MNYIINNCLKISAQYYLPLSHDALANYILKAIIKRIILTTDKFAKTIEDKEYWWNISIKTAVKISHSKHDLVIWDKANKLCSTVEFSCPADINITEKVNDKINVYGLLICNLQIMYQQYKFDKILIIVGALSYIPKCLTSYL